MYKDALKNVIDEIGQKQLDRRSFLMLGAAGAGAMLLSPGSANAAQKVKSSARIVVAGAGAAGLATASYLAAKLDGAKITLIDARKEHFYQPGFTLVASGIKQAPYVVSTTREYVPAGVELVEERVVEFDPEGNKVVTESGTAHAYDFLVVATGLKLDYDAIPGMDVEQIGNNGLGSIYHSPAKAEAMSAAIVRASHVALLVIQPSGADLWASGAAVKLIQAKRDIGGEIDAAFLVNRTSGSTKLSKLVQSGEWNTYEGIDKLESTIGNRAVFATAMTDGLSVLDYGDAKAKEELHAVIQELKEAQWL